MDVRKVALTGRVAREIRNAGSKSEHAAMVLKTGDGRSYVLRERGGNPFGPGSFDGLEGKSISTEGIAVDDGTVIVDSWRDADETP